MIRRTIFLSLSILALATAQAEIDRTRKPDAGPAPDAAFPEYLTRELPNGLKVFVIRDDRKPSITLRLLVKDGQSRDGDKPGLSGLVASLLNRGTKSRDARKFAFESDSIGAQVEALAGADAIALSGSALTKYTDQVIDLLVDAALNPVFPEDQLSRERQRVLSTLATEKQQPEQLAGKLSSRIIYGSDHPYGRFRTEESVSAITQQDLVAYHSSYFSPGNATLAIVGDVDPPTIVDRVGKAFAAWQKKEVEPITAPEVPKLAGLTIHLVDRPGSVQSNIIVASPGPARSAPDLPELNVANATLGGGFSGRLFQNLREKHGWTYGSYSAFDMQKLGGDFAAQAETRNEVTAPAITEILNEIRRLQDEPVPAAELQLQREYNVGNYLLSLESAARTAQRVQDIDLYGLAPEFYRTYAKRMAATSAEQVQAIAKKYLSVSDVAIIVVGEAKQVRSELEKIGKVVEYGLDLTPKQ